MARFTVRREGSRLEILFDDGGMNLLSSDALIELSQCLRGEKDHHRGTELLVFQSSRPGLFAAGADMAEMKEFSGLDARDFSQLGQETFQTIERLPFATVAIIDGDCFGGALDLALAFDFRFATPRSRFSHPGARLGIVTGFGGTSRWRGVIDAAAARRLFLANPVIDANDALSAGLVDRVGDNFNDELERISRAKDLIVVKELGRRGDRLSQRQLVELAGHLARVFDQPHRHRG